MLAMEEPSSAPIAVKETMDKDIKLPKVAVEVTDKSTEEESAKEKEVKDANLAKATKEAEATKKESEAAAEAKDE